VLEVLYHHAKFGGARISPTAGVAKNGELFCLFVCLSVMLLNVMDCAPHFAYGIGQTILFSSCGFFFFLFFPLLISAVADWISAILPEMVALRRI